MSGTLFRGQAIRRHADVQRMQIIHDPPTLSGRVLTGALRRALWALRWGTWATVMVLWAAVYIPPAGLFTVVAALALVLGGWWALALVSSLAGAGVWLWSRRWPRTWRWVESRGRRFWRRIRYRFTWDDVLAASGIKATDAAHRIVVPRLLWVRLGDHVDELSVQLCPGITPDRLAEQANALACEWCALEVRVTRHPRAAGWVLLRVVYTDPLADRPADSTRDEVDLGRLTLGRREDGRPWTLRVLGRHLLIAGSSGAGKGSVVTALLWALSPAIRDGWVRVIGVDPKGGMEFGMYPGLFHMLAMDSEAELVAALEAAAALAAGRCEALRGRTRLHRPTVDEPHYFVIVDEIASLTAYITDRGLKDRAKAALAVLLTKGRAPGFSVVGCVQDPRKEVLDLRNLFTVKIGLRLDSDTEVAMVLGDNAHDRGAHCEQINSLTPGIGYVVDDEDRRDPVKVRADYHDDAEMSWLSATYASPTHEDIPALATKAGKRRDAS